MILSHSEKQERYEARTAEYKAGEISEAVYGAYLYGLGYRGSALRSEVNLNRPEKKRGW
jgi:hypothetical protein